jgi:hypothetical protein
MSTISCGGVRYAVVSWAMTGDGPTRVAVKTATKTIVVANGVRRIGLSWLTHGM